MAAGASTAAESQVVAVAPLPEAMRAVAIDAIGDESVLVERSLPLPARLGAETLVRVVAAGVNPIDAKIRSGAAAAIARELRFPAVLGGDFSGVVAVSPYETAAFQPGDEVYGMLQVPRHQGGYAEYVAAPAHVLARKPRNLSHVEAAAVPLAALTAWGMVVETARVHEGQRVLVHAGAGGVGHFAVQLAAYFGAQVTATGSARNLDWLAELGASRVVDYTATRFEHEVAEQDVVIDLIGNVHDATGSRSLEVLRPGGLLVNAPSGSWPEMATEAVAAGVRATRFQVAPDAATLAVITRLLESGDLRVYVDEVFDLPDAAEAHRRLAAGHTRGKLVLTVARD